jgi:hypothetical protein
MKNGMMTNVGKLKKKHVAKQTMINRYTRINNEEYDEKRKKKSIQNM